MNAHVFVDESKADGLLLAAAVVPAQEVANLRKLIDSLRMPRQRRIHFTAESDARRKVILAALRRARVQVTIYDATSIKNVKSARDAALARLVDDAAKIGAQMLVFERDDPSEASDKMIIRSRLQIAGCGDTLRYAHKRAHAEFLLAIPNAVAWSWAKGSHWRQRVHDVVTEVAWIQR